MTDSHEAIDARGQSRRRWLRAMVAGASASAIIALTLVISFMDRDSASSAIIQPEGAGGSLESTTGSEQRGRELNRGLNPGASDTPADSEDLLEENPCGAEGCKPGDPLGPVAFIKGMELVSWSAGTEWWPHGALVRSVPAPDRASQESVFRFPSFRSRVPNPTKDMAGISVFYWNDRGSPFEAYFDDIRASGGIQVSVTFYPPGEHVPWSEGFFEQKAVVVRGHAARMVELRKDQNANVDWRAVRWEEPATGGTLQWEISNHPDVYTTEETLAFIEALKEVS